MSSHEIRNQILANVRELAHQTISNPKIASAVSGGTIASGVSTLLEWIPNDIGKLATLVGIVLSLVLIVTHLRNGYMQHKKAKLEIEILQRKAKELFDARKDRE